MLSWLIGISCFVVPFVTVRGQDIRELKSALAFVVMLIIGLICAYKGQMKAFKNKFVLIFIGYIWLSIMLSPSSGVTMAGNPLMQFWSWKPFTYILAYFMGIWAISSYEFTTDDLRRILRAIMWCGVSMSIFALLQFFNLDQFFRSNGQTHNQWNLVGTLGHPTFVSSFIAMTVPIAIYRKRYLVALVIFISVCMIQSMVAIGAMVISLLFLLGNRNKICGIITILLLISTISGVLYINHAKPDYIIKNSSGRFNEWPDVLREVNRTIRPEKDAKLQKYPITGRGIGSFYYTYYMIKWSDRRAKCAFRQAHNEYFELLYNNGIVGLILFLLAIGFMFYINIGINWYRSCLLASFLCIGISAGGLFVWQLGAHMLFTAIIVGLLHNSKDLLKE